MLAGEVDVEPAPRAPSPSASAPAASASAASTPPPASAPVVAEGKETRVIDGRTYILEAPLKADFAIIRAEYGDPFGNLRFKGTARNFSPQMAMAARVAVVEVDHLVPLGELAGEDIHLPGVFVQRIFQGRDYEDAIEYRTTRPRPEG
ncbi:MAG: CoA-transferase [bacterium]